MQATDAAVLETIYGVLRALNQERAADAQIVVGPATCLFGEASVLDSLSLVSVIVDLETQVSDTFGRNVSLTDDRAMSRNPVPFTDVNVMKQYLLELLAE